MERNTKRFYANIPLPAPTHCRQMSWGPPVLWSTHLHSFLINVPISPVGPGATPLGLSLGGLGISFRDAFGP